MSTRLATFVKQMSTDELHKGMNAFTHPPRNQSDPAGVDRYGCFCYEAFGGAYWRSKHHEQLSVDAREELSFYYECHPDELRGECLRELAERGAAPEAAPQEEPCLATM